MRGKAREGKDRDALPAAGRSTEDRQTVLARKVNRACLYFLHRFADFTNHQIGNDGTLCPFSSAIRLSSLIIRS